ncbi:hypothetical protein [Methylomonas albis]|uniref:DUF4124 domain-containing protein n=1 Tax=Methylomonas albis TaxID=1854563 RepID=A0ABR9D398_9GAMM|nr:hypothetical protein [Methylomonas albis]MBD9357582.1 hypothetical protein [Methylomonas albis]
MRGLILIAMVLSYHSASAEIFKCIGKDSKTVYQAKPCQTSDKAVQLDIQANEGQESAAKARLQALESEQDAAKVARQEAERRDAMLKNQTESTNALKQSAIAQQQQVEAEQRQAAALERQAQQNNNRVMIVAPPTALPVMPAPVTTQILR